MSSELQRRYEKLLAAYPQPYKSERGPEIVATLMDSSRDGQQWPTFRETRELLISGLRTHAWVVCGNDVRRMFLEGLWVYVLYRLFTYFVATADYARNNFGGSESIGTTNDFYVTLLPCIFLAAAMSFLRGYGTSALVAAAIAGSLLVLDYWERGLTSVGISIPTLLGVLIPVIAIVYMKRCGGELMRARSLSWLAIVVLPVITELVLPTFVGTSTTGFYGYLTIFGALPLVVVAVMRNIDPRFVVAAALELVVAALLQTVALVEFQFFTYSEPIGFIWPWVIVIALQLAIAAAAVVFARKGVRKLALTI